MKSAWQMNGDMAALLRVALSGESPLRPAWIADLLRGGFVEVDGCLLLGQLARPARPRVQLDRTGHEALINHFHIDATEGLADLAIGWDAANALVDLVRENGPQPPLRIIVTRDSAELPNTVVRLHRRRPTEPSFLADDLETYEYEAVAFQDIG